MYPHSFLWHYLWIAPHALQIVIAIIMIRRKLFREFPMFLTYTIFQVVLEGTLFILDHIPAVTGYQYWAVYWVGSVISIALRFAVISEIFSQVFSNYPGLKELSHILFRWATVVLLLVAIAVALHAPDDGSVSFLAAAHVLDRAVGLMQSGLLLLLLVFSSYFGLSWRSFTYGIAMGLAIFSCVDLATEAIRTQFVAGYIFDLVTMATYHCCVMIWLVYLLVPETARRTVKEPPENNLEQWNAELQRLLLQ
jgi:hypothetical protein